MRKDNKKTNKVLVTGGAGFLGTYLVKLLHDETRDEIVVFDKLVGCEPQHWADRVTYVKGDILSLGEVKNVFEKHGPFKTVYHLASAMPNKAVSDEVTWKTNVFGTDNLAKESVARGVKSFVFTSSNVTYGIPKSLPVTEETPLVPLEAYGKSKLQAERKLEKYKKNIHIQIFRCPVITGVGRLGLQSILYEFISENRNVYLLGDGLNMYQFVDAMDVSRALVKAGSMKGYDIYVIGGDGVMPLRTLYENVITYAGSRSKIVSLPKTLALWILVLLDKLNISPLGVYQYTMLSRSVYADTTKIKKKLGWTPAKTNLDSFIENYKWYMENKKTFKTLGTSKLSANRSLPKMGVFTLLKKLS